jgi:hypothetical protein
MLLKEVYLPVYLKLFDYSDADKKRYKLNTAASMRDLYVHYKCDKEAKGLTTDFEYKEFRETMLLFNLLLAKRMTEEGEWYKLPYGLGSFGISKFTPRYYKPRFKKEGVELYNNPHSEGFVAKFSWIKERALLKNRGLFRHKSVSHLKKSIAGAIFTLQSDSKYYEIPREEEMLTINERKKRSKVAERKNEANEVKETKRKKEKL